MRTAILASVAGSTILASAAFAADFDKRTVIEVDVAARTVTLDHGDVPNLEMPGMTMTFRVGAVVDIAKLRPGTAVEFTADNVDEEITVTGSRWRPLRQ
jgi:Cu(I)/Ag(I) efflux system protein CusF